MSEMKEVGFGKHVVVDAENSTVGGAVLEIEPGKRTDTIFHMQYEKVMFVLSGKIKATVIKDGRMSTIDVVAGQSFYVKPGLVHSLEAIERSVVIEFTNTDMYKHDIHCVFKGTPTSAETVAALASAATPKVTEPVPETKKPEVIKKPIKKTPKQTKKTKK